METESLSPEEVRKVSIQGLRGLLDSVEESTYANSGQRVWGLVGGSSLCTCAELAASRSALALLERYNELMAVLGHNAPSEEDPHGMLIDPPKQPPAGLALTDGEKTLLTALLEEAAEPVHEGMPEGLVRHTIESRIAVFRGILVKLKS
jgi:hypothetical protein